MTITTPDQCAKFYPNPFSSCALMTILVFFALSSFLLLLFLLLLLQLFNREYFFDFLIKSSHSKCYQDPFARNRTNLKSDFQNSNFKLIKFQILCFFSWTTTFGKFGLYFIISTLTWPIELIFAIETIIGDFYANTPSDFRYAYSANICQHHSFISISQQ